MGILASAGLVTYQGKYNVVSVSKFDESDKAAIRAARIVNSDYGKSVCLHLASGGTNYIPVSTDSKEVSFGDTVDLDKCEVLKLTREGDPKAIWRARIID